MVFATALEQARLIRGGEVRSVELVELYLRRIERLNPRLSAYLSIGAEKALGEARFADSRVGDEELPPLHGVAVSIKDMNNAAGLPTTMGLALSDNIPETDDHVVAKLRSAGAIVIGKTNTPALGLGPVTEPSAFEPCRNPYDLTRTPGGSSGGAAAALAAGLCAASQGSDGGGSIRIPSAWCGLVGIKPTRGRISYAPNPSSFHATDGPIARDVADAAALLDVMSGHVMGDAFWLPAPERPFLRELLRDPGNLRVAISFGGAEAAPDHRAAVETAAKMLEAKGHEIVEDEPDPTWAHVLEEHGIDLAGPGYRSRIEALPLEGELDPLVAQAIEFGAERSAEEWVAGYNLLLARARTVASFFETYDLVISPTVAKSPPLIGQHRELDFRDLFAVWEAYVPFTWIWSWTGHPAISIPVGLDSLGIPIGVQLVGRPAQESLLIRLASALEAELPTLPRPPIL